jgi:4-aminobutyrate aminotransferase/(S)-3-amino-2-methylpropionate transaminase
MKPQSVGTDMNIQIKTPLPGPKSIALMERRRAAVARGPFHSTPIFIKCAKGALVEDVDGNQLIDFASGIGVVNVGHTPQSVVTAVSEQAKQVLHAGFNVTPYESYVKLAEKLNQLTPGSFAKKTLLANSGAEAVENAIKIARAFTKRQAVICFDHAFHGRTYMALALTSKAKPYKLGFAPFPAEIYRAPFPYSYLGMDGDTAFKKFEELVSTQVVPSQVAAVIIEPVLGEGGFVPAPKEFLAKLSEFCSNNGIVLIADEIQTGFGRTGTLFASQQLEFIPDIITMAKGMGAGLPISAVTGRMEIMDAPMEGGVGGTYGGNPLACAAALAVLEIFEKEEGELLKRSRKIGETLRNRMNHWKDRFQIIGDVRGLGPMMGMELVKDRQTKEPYREAVASLVKYNYEHGVLTLSAGTFGNVLRLLMPLVIEEDQLKEGLDVLEAGLNHLSQMYDEGR